MCLFIIATLHRKLLIRIQSGENIVYNPNCSIPVDYDTAVNYTHSNGDDRDTSNTPLIII